FYGGRKTRTPPERGREGRGLGNPHGVGGMKGYVTRAPLRKLAGRAKGSSRNVVLWDFFDTWRIFLPDQIAGPFSCSNLTTRRGACCMGIETILLIVILAFAGGFVLDRLARARLSAAAGHPAPVIR